jgi:hypothetical protein
MKVVAICPLHSYFRQGTISQQESQLLPHDLGRRGLNNGFVIYGMGLRLSVCVVVKCYKVAFRSGYQKARLSTSSNWLYRTGPRFGSIEKRFTWGSSLSESAQSDEPSYFLWISFIIFPVHLFSFLTFL